MIEYRLEPDLTPDAFIDVLVRSTLAERRPIGDRRAIEKMLANADLIVTARVVEPDGEPSLLVGISRAITDFAFCTYLSDLAVDEQYQGRGIGRELIARTHQAAGLDTTLILLSAPKAQTYYPHIGMTKHESCWTIARRAPQIAPRPPQDL